MPLVAKTKRRRARPRACVQTAASGRAACAGGRRLGRGDREHTSPGRQACLLACALGAAVRRGWARQRGHFAAVSIPPPGHGRREAAVAMVTARSRPRPPPRAAPRLQPAPAGQSEGRRRLREVPFVQPFRGPPRFWVRSCGGRGPAAPSPLPFPAAGLWDGVGRCAGCKGRAGTSHRRPLPAGGGWGPGPRSGRCERAEGPRRGVASSSAGFAPRELR